MTNRLFKKRSQSSVNYSARQYSIFAGLAFSLNKTRAGNFAGSIKLFHVVHRQIKKSQSLLLVVRHADRGEDYRLAIFEHHRSVSLLRQVCKNSRQIFSTNFHTIFFFLHFVRLPFRLKYCSWLTSYLEQNCMSEDERINL